MNFTTLTVHVLQHLAEAQSSGTAVTLDTLVEAVGARRADVRRSVTALHEAGLVDALRMRLTLCGFAAGRALRGMSLPPLRQRRVASDVAAA